MGWSLAGGAHPGSRIRPRPLLERGGRLVRDEAYWVRDSSLDEEARL